MNQVDLTGPVLLHSLFMFIQDNMEKLRGKLRVDFTLVLVKNKILIWSDFIMTTVMLNLLNARGLGFFAHSYSGIVISKDIMIHY